MSYSQCVMKVVASASALSFYPQVMMRNRKESGKWPSNFTLVNFFIPSSALTDSDLSDIVQDVCNQTVMCSFHWTKNHFVFVLITAALETSGKFLFIYHIWRTDQSNTKNTAASLSRQRLRLRQHLKTVWNCQKKKQHDPPCHEKGNPPI